MRALKTLFKLTLWLTLMTVVAVGGLAPGVYMYTAANLPYAIDSELDIELHLRQSIESERQSVQLTKQARDRVSVKWEKPDFSRLPKHLIAFYITQTGCPDYFRSPREEGWPWINRVFASLQGRMLDGDGACELIYARGLARRMSMKTEMQVAVAADRIHRFLTKDDLVAYNLHSNWFAKGEIGVERGAEILLQKPLNQLTLAEIAELQLAIPPLDFWDTVMECRDTARIKQGRDKIIFELAMVGHISDEMARTAAAQPLRCEAVKR